MSRIGRLPIAVPAGVTVSVSPENVVTVKGPKGELSREVNPIITVNVDANVVTCTRANDEQETKAMHGLYRKLIANMVEGVSNGFTKTLVINGVGYRAQVEGKRVKMDIGYSHPIYLEEIKGITYSCPSDKEIAVSGIDKELVGQVAADIRTKRIPDPYHHYGVRYSNEELITKEGKKGGKGKK